MTARKAQASERLHDFVESAGMWTASTGQEAWQGAIRKAGTWRLPGTFDGRVRMVQLGAGRCFVRIERVINHLYYYYPEPTLCLHARSMPRSRALSCT
eukprot:COSAG02_NODE_104_length_36421_cov_132.465420_19_plen_98_part_00